MLNGRFYLSRRAWGVQSPVPRAIVKILLLRSAATLLPNKAMLHLGNGQVAGHSDQLIAHYGLATCITG